MFVVTSRCGWCQERGGFRFAHAFGFTPINPDEGDEISQASSPGQIYNRTANSKANEQVEGAAIAQCPQCHRPSMFLFDVRRSHLRSIQENLAAPEHLMGGESLVRIKCVHPPQPCVDEDPHWPEAAVQPFKDVQKMLMSGITPSIIIGVCRTVLDVVTRELGASEGTLKQRIDALQEQAVITTPIADWAHTLRLDGNEAVHAAKGERDNAPEYIEFLRTLMNVTFSLPAKIARQRANGV